MKTKDLTDVEVLVLRVLDKWKGYQLNLASEHDQLLIAQEIGKEVEKEFKQMVEDICCGG